MIISSFCGGERNDYFIFINLISVVKCRHTLYDSTVNPKTGAEFHKCCDYKGPTIFLMFSDEVFFFLLLFIYLVGWLVMCLCFCLLS